MSSKPKVGQLRRRAREFALQAIFQWSVNPVMPEELCSQFIEDFDFSATDIEYFMNLVTGTVANIEEIDPYIAASITRDMDSVNALVKAILRLAIYEFIYCPQVPYRVVINEAIELQKSYGADEGRAFVNAVLDKLAPQLRTMEYNAANS